MTLREILRYIFLGKRHTPVGDDDLNRRAYKAIDDNRRAAANLEDTIRELLEERDRLLGKAP